MSALAPQSAESGRAAVDACWNSIGIRGDQTCPRLTRHIHCRNCPTYSAAARALLDSPAPTGYASLWTDHYAQSARQSESETRSVMIFRVGVEWFALQTLLCIEVASARPLHSLPHRSQGALLGLASVRGELVACISLATLLRVDPEPSGQSSRGSSTKRLLVAGWQDGSVAFPVDEVHGVHRFRLEEFKDAPATVAHSQAGYTKAVVSFEKRIIGLLDEELLGYTIRRSLA